MGLRRAIGAALLLLLIFQLLVIQVLSLFIVVGTIVNYIYTAIAYATIAGLVWLERDHLNDFHLDRFTLVLLILISLLRTRLGVGGESYFLLVIGLAGVAIAIVLVPRDALLQSSKLHWLLVAVVVSCAVLVPIAILESSRFQPATSSSSMPIGILPLVLRQIVYQLSFTALIEELIFRGFLWGYLQELGWPENRAMWAQGIAFWLFHFPQAGAVAHFFVAVPLGAAIYTVLTKKSRQLGPAVVSHTIINAIAPLIAAMFHF